VAGDETVDHPLDAAALAACRALIVVDPGDLLPADRDRLSQPAPRQRRFESATAALSTVAPAVKVAGARPVRVLPRVRAGSAVIHLLNYGYDSSRDEVTPMDDVVLTVDCPAIGISEVNRAALLTPEGGEAPLPCHAGQVTVPRLGLWALVRLEGPAR